MSLKQKSILLTIGFALFNLGGCQHKDMDSLQQQGDLYYKISEFKLWL